MKKIKLGKFEIILENQKTKNTKKETKKLSVGEYIKLRWKYLIGGYFIGYIASLGYYYHYNNFIDFKGYFPLKGICLICALVFGNFIYYITEENDWFIESSHYQKVGRLFKYIIISIILIFAFVEIDKYLINNFNINITCLMGFGD